MKYQKLEMLKPISLCYRKSLKTICIRVVNEMVDGPGKGHVDGPGAWHRSVAIFDGLLRIR